MACVLLAGAFFVTGSPSALAAALVIFLLPGTSVIASRSLASSVNLSFSHKSSCAVGQPIQMEVVISRPRLFRSRIELLFSCHNALTGVTDEVPVTIFPSLDKTERFGFALESEWCGAVSVSLVSAKMGDTFGFSLIEIPMPSYASSYVVYPPVSEIDVRLLHAAAVDDAGCAFDPYRPGSDRTEVFDIREFGENDSLKAVHWKVSARFDDLMVREASRPTNLDVEVVCGVLMRDADEGSVNGGLSALASVSLSMLRQGIGHCVTFFDSGAIVRMPVESRTNFDAMLDTLVTTPLPSEREIASAFSARTRRLAAKTVLVCNSTPNDSCDRLAAETDLSVLVVGSEAPMASSSMRSYRVTSLSSDHLSDSVKNLEL